MVKEFNGSLAEFFKKATIPTFLYCDYYYFVLRTPSHLEFWLHPFFRLGRLEVAKVPRRVFKYLDKHCPRFSNFHKDEQYNEDSTADWRENSSYYQNIPEIGNAYSAIVYKIVTELDENLGMRVMHLHQDYGPSLWAVFETMGEKELHAFLTMNVFSNTAKHIKEIEQLACFQSNDNGDVEDWNPLIKP